MVPGSLAATRNLAVLWSAYSQVHKQRLGFSGFPGSQLCYQCIITVLLSCPWFLIATKFVLIFYFYLIVSISVSNCFALLFWSLLVGTVLPKCLQDLSLACARIQAHRYGMKAQTISDWHSLVSGNFLNIINIWFFNTT